MLQSPLDGIRPFDNRVGVGVAARLSRYLQVLTQAKKMGKDRISSQEIADYTNINATQIRRDLSNFGKFGKRGVGYSIDGLLGEIRKILRTQGQHNIALVGAGRLGQAIAGSPIFVEHGITIAAVFDVDERSRRPPDRRDRGQPLRPAEGRRPRQEHRRRRARGPGRGAQQVADDLVDAGVRIIFNYSEALLDVPAGRDRAHLEPRRRAPARALLPPDLIPGQVPCEWARAEASGPRRGTIAWSAGGRAGASGPRRGSSGVKPAAGELMRILLWHGYLLDGTGSNVYTRALAREWSLAGHDVTVVCQEPAPERYDLGGAATVRPELPGRAAAGVRARPLPGGLEARLLQDFSAAERRRYVEANVAALRELLPADLVFTNHVLMGGAVGAALGEPLPRQGARLRARVLDPRPARARARGRGSACGGRGGLRRLAAHP